MTDEDIAELQNDDEWDFEAAVTQHAPRNRRAVVSVGFRPDEFAQVATAARDNDQPVSQFIREAALNRARHRYLETDVHQAPRIIVIRTQKSGEIPISDVLKSLPRRLVPR